MGTRGTSGFIYENKPKLSYNHFDSYPSGLGREMLKLIVEINKKNFWDKLKQNAPKIKFLKEENINEEIIDKYKKYSNLNVSKQSYYDPYCLFREIQGSDWILEMINGDLEHFNFSNNFIKDSLYCEYGYIINLDTMKLEFYDGSQHSSQSGNIFGEEPNKNGYYPCKLVDVVDLISITEQIDIIVDKWESDFNESKKVNLYLQKSKRKDKLKEIENHS